MVFAATPERKAVVKAVPLQSLKLPVRMSGLDSLATISDQPIPSTRALKPRLRAIIIKRRMSGQNIRCTISGRSTPGAMKRSPTDRKVIAAQTYGAGFGLFLCFTLFCLPGCSIDTHSYQLTLKSAKKY